MQIYSESKKRLGVTKIQVVLLRDYGINISVGRVYRLMKGMQLPKMSTVKPKFTGVKQTSSDCSNHLNQEFNPEKPNQIWASDITYIKMAKGFAYLCVVMDLFSRKIISYRVGNKMDAHYVVQTLHDAIRKRKPGETILFHSDQGTQYTSGAFRKFCDDHNIMQSFSKKAYPWDNSVLESFFKYAKREEFSRRSFDNISQVQLAAFT